jgi:hypothetical protein
LIIRRALELKEALNIYANDLRDSDDFDNQEIFQEDYITAAEWRALEIIKNQLEPLFRLTKDLEGNYDLKDGVRKALYSALWEVLPVFEFLLSYFEKLEKKAKAGDFNKYPGIQSSITLAWNTIMSWYKKTDNSLI